MEAVDGKTALGFEPKSTAEYLDPQYWQQRFEKEEEYDWFKGLHEFKHLLLPHMKPSDRILILGCGNSTLTVDLWKEGFRDITSIDLSEVVVRKMAEKAQSMPELKWKVADMLDLPFGDCSFDVVLEKGTMDVLFVDNDSPWDPDARVIQRVHQMLGEVHRVLTASGVFVSVTFSQPHFRNPFFRAPQYTWGIRHDSFGQMFHYFVYALKKGTAAGDADAPQRDEKPPTPADYGKEPMTHAHMDDEGYLLCIGL